MSEFELLTLFNEYFDATFARLNDFMAGTFAMLIVPTMAILLLGAFAGTLAFFFHARKSGIEGAQ